MHAELLMEWSQYLYFLKHDPIATKHLISIHNIRYPQQPDIDTTLLQRLGFVIN